jgi:hypothetical protein
MLLVFLCLLFVLLCANHDTWERFLICRADPSRSELLRAGIVLIQGPRKGKPLDEGRAFAGLMI